MSKSASSIVTIPSRAQTWPANLDSQGASNNPAQPPLPPSIAAGAAKPASVRDAPDDDDGQIVNDDDENPEPVTDPNDPKIFRDGRAPRPTDVFIAVMGVTGCGKSSFISLCCNKPVQIGHDLKSCTAVVDVYPFELSSTQTVYLIDTPGFDDTAKNDTEVLREIASWLTESFKSKILLHGIIYLHRISDVRMQGSAKKNLLMFKKLCGDDALRKVILATTMWDIVPREVAQARETELVETPEFWGYMVSKGSRLCRHDKTPARAREIVQSLITGGDRSRPTIVLDLQDQMVTQARPLQETAAGIELEAELARERKRWEKELKEAREMMKEAIRLRDSESEKAMRELRNDYTNKIEKLKSEHKKLRTDTEQLHTERFLRFKKAIREQDTAKRSEGHEERQVGWTGAPYFAYSIVGNHSYSLAGSWSQWGNCMSDRSYEKMKTINGGRCVLTWCGVGGSWVQKFQTGHMTWMTRFNRNLARCYPDLREKLRRPGGAWDTEWPDWICLGPFRRYILQWDMKLPTADSGDAAQPEGGSVAVLTRHRMDWCLPDPAAEALQKARKGGRLRAAALGVKGAYIFVPETGPAVWDLAGSYANMKRFLENQSTDIEAVALNPVNDDFILHYRNGYVFASLERSCLTIQGLDAWSLKNQ
ncbi:hypothetical protein MAPG_09495 [Magnaporthiopsis poae ATCC 64411]|uniref:G domain-containing protein n=1 Tax=Magnaporthiopsis poae (strain ATCC 64411 / 73-15) TaxID=644358 RepID=A0A0C4EA39_MAGP6|nr:hypothetical protein MAPG_09495 [Magnaporthiopsis poae ATCC 64411]